MARKSGMSRLLDTGQKVILALSPFLNDGEIAAMLGIPENRLRQIRFQALKKLREGKPKKNKK